MSNDLNTLIGRVADAERVLEAARATVNAAEEALRTARDNAIAAEDELQRTLRAQIDTHNQVKEASTR